MIQSEYKCNEKYPHSPGIKRNAGNGPFWLPQRHSLGQSLSQSLIHGWWPRILHWRMWTAQSERMAQLFQLIIWVFWGTHEEPFLLRYSSLACDICGFPNIFRDTSWLIWKPKSYKTFTRWYGTTLTAYQLMNRCVAFEDTFQSAVFQVACQNFTASCN